MVHTWRIIEHHIKACTRVRKTVAVSPGKPLWNRSDKVLKNHTQEAETELTYELPVWSDLPAENEVTGQAELISQIWSEWQQQVINFQEAAANIQDEQVDNKNKKVT